MHSLGSGSSYAASRSNCRAAEWVTLFLEEAHAEVRARGVMQGASLFGIAASRPDSIAQPVPEMARHTDFIAPMLYPSHWTDGEYRVQKPNEEPDKIVERALADFVEQMEGTNKPLVPWLQDFSLGGVTYGPVEVRKQIEAIQTPGVAGFLLWNPGVVYSAAALDPQ